MDAWRVEVEVRQGLPDPAGTAARTALADAGLPLRGSVRSRRGFLLDARLDRSAVEKFAAEVLADPITDTFEVFAPTDRPAPVEGRVTVRPRPGVTDQVAISVQKALADSGHTATGTPLAAGTYHAWFLADADRTCGGDALHRAAERSLANEVVQEILMGAPPEGLPGPGGEADLAVHPVPIRDLDDAGLETLSRDGGLALTIREMRAVQAHFAAQDREPTRTELETIAQTWSEHCKHKTLTGRIRFGDEVIDNLLKSEIAAVTRDLDREFCVSVFVDNAGIITFDDEDSVCIKVETHNRPSAIEPFGGAATGVGGVIRDVLGTGLGARPVASTDVFCFAPPDTPDAEVPAGCLHPLRVLKGVVAGVRDYGNPMGIPTVHGAIHFDPDFIGNPLVYVGNIGILPTAKAHKKAHPGDRVVVVGGRVGRDGIHGATFSSLGLHTDSEMVSSGAVQIGDPITERKVMDLVLRARDAELFTAVTDCGAGGLSSAVGEMAEGLGVEVDLALSPLKYAGLAPWEIWVSEAQERMVLAVPPEHVDALLALCDEEDVEGAVLGTFTDSGRIVLRYRDTVHADLDLDFVHDGVPVFEREACWSPPEVSDPDLPEVADLGAALLAVLRDPNVASKEWVIRQYDHEVQAGSAGKPLVGIAHDGPGDGAVIAPKLGSTRGVVLSSGLNPRYSRIDPAAMAECALDEAMRNVVAQGGNPDHTAVLDNYSWANCAVPEQLGALVRATRALCSLARVYRTPFVSGKDSLNNSFQDGDRTISIPGCILVTAMSVVPDVTATITSAPVRPDGRLWIIGRTRRELGGSVHWKTRGALGASVPRVRAEEGRDVLFGTARAIEARAISACHDLSEGGLGAAVAEMAIAGRIGVEIDLDRVLLDGDGPFRAEEILFSESASRFVCEVPADREADLRANLHEVPAAEIGAFTTSHRDLVIRRGSTELARVPVDDLVRAWKAPLDFDAAHDSIDPAHGAAR